MCFLTPIARAKITDWDGNQGSKVGQPNLSGRNKVSWNSAARHCETRQAVTDQSFLPAFRPLPPAPLRGISRLAPVIGLTAVVRLTATAARIAGFRRVGGLRAPGLEEVAAEIVAAPIVLVRGIDVDGRLARDEAALRLVGEHRDE